MITGKQNQLFFAGVIVLFLIMAALMGGLLREKPAPPQSDQTIGIPETTEIPDLKTTMDKVSSELKMLNSKGWGTLASDLKRPRATTLLWYHLKKLIGFEPKVVFGNANKLNTALAIPVRMGGDSLFPSIRIKELYRH